MKQMKGTWKMNKKVAIYSRVSTDHQEISNQLIELRETASRLNYQISKEYLDDGISGMKTQEERPGLDQLLKDANLGKFDMLMIFDVTRLGRNLQNCIEILNHLNSLNIEILIHKQSINTSTPVGRLTFSLLASLGEYERNLMRERIVSGIKRAQSQGKKCGRPTSVNEGLRKAIKILRDKGMGIVAISRELNCGVGTIYSVIKPQ